MARLMRNPSEVCRKVDLHAHLFPDEVEAELHRIDVVISRLRNKARSHGMTLPIRAILAKARRLFPEVSHRRRASDLMRSPPVLLSISYSFICCC